MAEKPKRPVGRPRKAAPDKQGQFSIRLPFMGKLMLELLAREQNMSLSQAVDFAVKRLADTYEIEGKSVASLAREAYGRLLEKVNPDVYEIGRSTTSHLMVRSTSESVSPMNEAEKAFMFPDHLRTDEERFFVQVLELLGDDGSRAMQSKEDSTVLWSVCKNAFAANIRPNEVVAFWRQEVNGTSKG